MSYCCVHILKSSGDDSYPHLPFHLLVDHCSEYDMSILMGVFLNQHGSLVDFQQGEVFTAGDVDQDSLCAVYRCFIQ